MAFYAAIDLHSNNIELVILDDQDHVMYERRLPNNLALILRKLSIYGKDMKGIAVESTYNWYWLVDGMMEAGYDVRFLNTVAVKIYDGLKSTDDEHDARHLAHLLRLGLLLMGYIYPKEERGIRDLLRKRAQLIRHRTAQIVNPG